MIFEQLSAFFFLLSRCSWLCLSNSPQLLHSTQVWWECMSLMCTWRNGCNEDTHASNLWNTGILKIEDQIFHISILIHGFISVHLYVLTVTYVFVFFLSPAGHNMQWCFDDLLLWNIWNMSNDQRNSYQEWRDLVTAITVSVLKFFYIFESI